MMGLLKRMFSKDECVPVLLYPDTEEHRHLPDDMKYMLMPEQPACLTTLHQCGVAPVQNIHIHIHIPIHQAGTSKRGVGSCA